MRDDSTDTNPFLNWTTLYSDCVIGMDLNNWKMTFTDKINFTVFVRHIYENVVVDFILVAATATIDFEETVVDELLTVAGESMRISVSKGILRNMSWLKTNAPGE